MKRTLFLSASILALATFHSPAELSPTDHLAVNSGVSLWLSAWKSPGKADAGKLQPLYIKNVVTNPTAGAGQVKHSWAEFADVIREHSANLAAVIAAQKDDPQVTVVQDRIVTSFSSGIRLVWQKTNGVWVIVEQNLPGVRRSMTALAE
jgi:hypothetical protein